MIENKPYDLNELDRFSFGDEEFKKELIDIFIEQLPDFIANLNLYFDTEQWENLAREAHTAKSSVLIFGMHNTGKVLKEIQNLTEEKSFSTLPDLIKSALADMNLVLEHLKNLS